MAGAGVGAGVEAGAGSDVAGVADAGAVGVAEGAFVFGWKIMCTVPVPPLSPVIWLVAVS